MRQHVTAGIAIPTNAVLKRRTSNGPEYFQEESPSCSRWGQRCEIIGANGRIASEGLESIDGIPVEEPANTGTQQEKIDIPKQPTFQRNEVCMFKRGAVTVVAVAAVFAAGFWLGSEKTVQGFGQGRVFELRTYTAGEGKLAALQARFRDHTTKLFEKHGIQNVGYWVPADAPASQNTLTYIVAFPDREAAKKSWTEFMNDPEWKKVQQESEAGGKLVDKIDSVFMNPTDYSPIR